MDLNDILFGWIYKTPMEDTPLDVFVASCWCFLVFTILYLIYKFGDRK